ncbi:MAG: hypothetical protein PHT12_06190 [Patescibacteria group bacterium]|nr:hypothetical protein [Patescibacteria group bacterium]
MSKIFALFALSLVLAACVRKESDTPSSYQSYRVYETASPEKADEWKDDGLRSVDINGKRFSYEVPSEWHEAWPPVGHDIVTVKYEHAEITMSWAHKFTTPHEAVNDQITLNGELRDGCHWEDIRDSKNTSQCAGQCIIGNEAYFAVKGGGVVVLVSGKWSGALNPEFMTKGINALVKSLRVANVSETPASQTDDGDVSDEYCLKTCLLNGNEFDECDRMCRGDKSAPDPQMGGDEIGSDGGGLAGLGAS